VLHVPPISYTWFYLHKIWWRVQIMKLLIMQFPPSSCYILSLRSKLFPQWPVTKLSEGVI
jgi:hypothetical protein